MLLFLALAAITPVEDEAAQRAQWERGQAQQRAFERRLFAEAGFPPIAEAEADGRQLRRLVLSDPYMMLPVPALELERVADRRVTMRLQYRGWSSAPVPVDAAVWDDLARKEAAVFAPAVFVPTAQRPAVSSAPPSICHGWIGRIAAGYRRVTSWAACGGTDRVKYDYIVRMIEAALATRPDCEVKRDDPLWSFNNCFRDSGKLDDPALQAKFAELQATYAKAEAADELALARRSLAASGLEPGSPAWLEARAAVQRFGQVQTVRREQLRQLRVLSSGASRASEADRARMTRAIAIWAEWIESQDRNYAGLLQRLAWPTGSGEAATPR